GRAGWLSIGLGGSGAGDGRRGNMAVSRRVVHGASYPCQSKSYETCTGNSWIRTPELSRGGTSRWPPMAPPWRLTSPWIGSGGAALDGLEEDPRGPRAVPAPRHPSGLGYRTLVRFTIGWLTRSVAAFARTRVVPPLPRSGERGYYRQCKREAL